MTKNKQSIALLGYASGVAAGDPGTADGPLVFQKSNICEELSAKSWQGHWLEMIHPSAGKSKVDAVAEICTTLAKQAKSVVEQKEFFTVFAGDHSCAIGTWSGVSAALKASIGLIWIDAHMDSHTPETSESGNIHGMPVATLLGHGAPQLTKILHEHPKLKPEHVCLIGIRSYEAGEADLIKRLGVRVFDMEEIKKRSISAVLQEALTIVKKGTVGFGISIDLDGIDPIEAPGVGTPEAGGIAGVELCRALKIISADPQLIGAEIVEYNPHHDKDHLTENLIKQLLFALLPHKVSFAEQLFQKLLSALHLTGA